MERARPADGLNPQPAKPAADEGRGGSTMHTIRLASAEDPLALTLTL